MQIDKITLTVTVPAEKAGQRLDQVLSELLPDYSRTRLQSWIKQGDVLKLTGLRGREIRVKNITRKRVFMARHNLFDRASGNG